MSFLRVTCLRNSGPILSSVIGKGQSLAEMLEMRGLVHPSMTHNYAYIRVKKYIRLDSCIYRQLPGTLQSYSY